MIFSILLVCVCASIFDILRVSQLCFRLKPVEIAFLEEYCITMRPVAQALNILQSEKKAYLGYLLPTVTALQEKLQKRREKATSCIALVDALLAGIRKRFATVLADNQAIAAAILHPTFTTNWPADASMLQLGI